MDIEIKNKWIAALRSGDYEQGKYRLHTSGGEHCCLGVLELACNLKSDFDEYIDEITASQIGLTHDTQTDLMAMNDNEGKNFNEIADWIEANL